MVDIGFNIKSIFDNSGLKEAKQALEALEGTSNEMDISAKELDSRMDALNASFDESKNQFRAANGQFMDFADITGPDAALKTMADQTDRTVDVVENRLSASRMELKETEKGVSIFQDSITGDMEETQGAIASVSNQVRSFNEEALSALFASMAVGRQISDLTRPGMEAAGVFDLISNTLEIFFLPIALKVRDIVLELRDWFLGMPTWAKVVVGAIALIIGGLAKIGAVIAGVILNFGGLATIQALVGGFASTVAGYFSAMAGAVGISMGSIVAFLTSPIVIIAAVIAAIAGLFVAWKKNLFGIRQKVGKFVKWIGNNFPKIVRAVVPVIGVMDLLIKAVNRLFGKDIDTLGEQFRGVGDDIADMGDEMIESGEKMDEMKDKAPDKQKQGFVDKYMPDVGGSKTSAKGTSSGSSQPQVKNNNTYNINAKESHSEKKIAREVDRLHKKSKENSTRDI